LNPRKAFGRPVAVTVVHTEYIVRVEPADGRVDGATTPEAFPWNEAPRYLIHDRDTAFYAWTTTPAAIGIEEILTAPRSPWQNAYAERVIGSIRRECLDRQ
jgi:transposase InsO family protein